MELKDVSPNTANMIKKNYWEKQAKNPESSALINEVKQIRPTAELLDRFESRRTELESKGKGPLRTIWAFYGSNKERIDSVLKHGFERSMSGAAIVCWEDPETAIKFAEGKQLLLCRIALGVNGIDYEYDPSTGRYSVNVPSQVMPTWFISLK